MDLSPRHRRDFIKALPAMTCYLASPSTRTFAGATAQGKSLKQPSEIWVDTHLHCFAGKEDTRFPYHPQGPYYPEQPATPEHLIQCMDQAGVDYAVVVHPEPYQDDHRYLEHCLQLGQGRLKGVGLFFSDRPGSLDRIGPLLERIPLVALRVHAYAPDRLPPFGSPELERLWRIASEKNLAIQLHLEPRYARGFTPLIKAFPSTTVIIDHLGRPFQGLPEEHAEILAWAKQPQVIMKLSSIPSERQYPHRAIEPIINQLLACFGSERLIYGGGFNAETTGKTYAASFERARGFLSDLSQDEQAMILGGNAARLFGWKNV